MKGKVEVLGTLVKKEITETILDLRFFIATVLCMVLIPLGMYVSRKDYEQRLSNYGQERLMYEQNYATNVISYDVQAQGFRPPSPLSIFASGITSFLPDKVITSRTGLFRTGKNFGMTNPEALLFGKTDLLFIVSYVISLVALLFTYNTISAEKERGTLRLMVANSLPRGQILLAKIVGNFLALLIPLTISLLISLLILNASPAVSISSVKFLPQLILLILFIFLYVLSMMILGICISSLTSRSATSLICMLLVWVLFVLTIPRISPMLAEVVYPIESQNVIDTHKRIIAHQIDKEFEQKSEQLLRECRSALGITNQGLTWGNPTEMKAIAEYDQKIIPVRIEFEKRKADEIRKIEQDYGNRRNMQTTIARNISRLSPVSCFTYLVTNISNTGITDLAMFWDNAQQFQEVIDNLVYNNVIKKIYKTGSGGGPMVMNESIDGFNITKVTIPPMKYRYATLAEALQYGWIDLLLLCMSHILFFVVAFIRFRKYDVR